VSRYRSQPDVNAEESRKPAYRAVYVKLCMDNFMQKGLFLDVAEVRVDL